MPKTYDAEKTERLKSLLTNIAKGNPQEGPESLQLYREDIINCFSTNGTDEDSADPNVVDETYGNTILLFAILYKDEELAQRLIELDVVCSTINQADSKEVANNSPLVLAIKTGLYNVALKLLEKGADPNQAAGEENFTPLHYAVGLLGISYTSEKNTKNEAFPKAELQLLKVIYKLLEMGADNNTKNNFDHKASDLLEQKVSYEDLRVYSYERVNAQIICKNFNLNQTEFEDIKERICNNETVLDRKTDIFYWTFAANIYFKYNGLDYEQVIKKLTTDEILYLDKEKYNQLVKLGKPKQILTAREIIDDKNNFTNFNYLADFTQENCLLKKLIPQETTHAEGINSWLSLNAGTCWHRNIYNKKNNREGFSNILVINKNNFQIRFEQVIKQVISDLKNPEKNSEQDLANVYWLIFKANYQMDCKNSKFFINPRMGKKIEKGEVHSIEDVVKNVHGRPNTRSAKILQNMGLISGDLGTRFIPKI